MISCLKFIGTKKYVRIAGLRDTFLVLPSAQSHNGISRGRSMSASLLLQTLFPDCCSHNILRQIL